MDDCIEWMKGRQKNGYGRWAVKRNGRWIMRLAHREAYERAHGLIPEGMNVLHRCDNRACINPAHLFLGTQADNIADMVAKDRHPQGTRHPLARLTEPQVRLLRIMTDAGWPHKEVGQLFGISRRQATAIANREAWMHLA